MILTFVFMRTNKKEKKEEKVEIFSTPTNVVV